MNNRSGICAWWCHQMETFAVLLALCAGIHGSLVNSAHKGQWRRALKFSLICAWTNDWVNNRDAGDLRRHRANYDVTLMEWMDEWQWHLQEVYNVLKRTPAWNLRYYPKLSRKMCINFWLNLYILLGTNHTKARVVCIFMDAYNIQREMVITKAEGYFQCELWFITVKPLI